MDKKERNKQYYIKNKAIILERNKLCNAKREDKNRKEYYKKYYDSVRKPKNKLNKNNNKKKHTHTTTSHTQEQHTDYIERRRQELLICSNPFK